MEQRNNRDELVSLANRVCGQRIRRILYRQGSAVTAEYGLAVIPSGEDDPITQYFFELENGQRVRLGEYPERDPPVFLGDSTIVGAKDLSDDEDVHKYVEGRRVEQVLVNEVPQIIIRLEGDVLVCIYPSIDGGEVLDIDFDPSTRDHSRTHLRSVEEYFSKCSDPSSAKINTAVEPESKAGEQAR